jgi:hypothetical protein
MSSSGQRDFAVLERIQAGKEMLVRIVAILTKLVERFDPDQYRVRENASGVAQSFEHEDDDEHEHEERQKEEGRSYLSASCFVLPFAFLLLPFLVESCRWFRSDGACAEIEAARGLKVMPPDGRATATNCP